MRKVPINPECDPRITCQLSVQYKSCMNEDKMKDITNAWDPKQTCRGVSNYTLTCSFDKTPDAKNKAVKLE